ncbi:unnamed protein product [Effrenium voratum]|uniref:Uncharacterized protein n=1 Tax=Effrenium voratum TaxID=2562239 RepID=A0AA36HPK8_9DINO|nr:unnamed protein product [Effrenium voratum]
MAVKSESRPIFVEAKVKMHGILRNLSFAGLLALDGQRSAVELRPLLAQQRGLCEGADLDSTAEAAREVLDETIKKLMSGQDHVTPQARLLKMMHRGRNVSVFAERQAAEREAYLERLCEFNRSLIGNFIRMIDVIQQSCLVDLAVSKVRSLYDRFARTPKLFQVSAAFEPAPGPLGAGAGEAGLLGGHAAGLGANHGGGEPSVPGGVLPEVLQALQGRSFGGQPHGRDLVRRDLQECQGGSHEAD